MNAHVNSIILHLSNMFLSVCNVSSSEPHSEVTEWAKNNISCSPWACNLVGKTNQITIWIYIDCHLFSSVQSLSRVWLFVTPWTAVCQAFLSITNSLSLPKLMSIESVMPFNHLILCHPLLLLPSIFPSIKIFSIESALHIRCPEVLELQLQHQSFQWTPRTDLL